jgi:hypothetical protein
MVAAYIGIAITAVVVPFLLFLLGFMIGRCARRIPIIDNNLPWTMSRDQSSSKPPSQPDR